jgi:hypothetical protein
MRLPCRVPLPIFCKQIPCFLKFTGRVALQNRENKEVPCKIFQDKELQTISALALVPLIALPLISMHPSGVILRNLEKAMQRPICGQIKGKGRGRVCLPRPG